MILFKAPSGFLCTDSCVDSCIVGGDLATGLILPVGGRESAVVRVWVGSGAGRKETVLEDP
ncbi:hypothetical protein CBD41_06515 [bacterium TMED181]|nr:hypothetical protein [Planctomycetota bacterium]OUW43959.1 MAG: hypothetical protein CBD41_06515 [bacterium TMED181]